MPTSLISGIERTAGVCGGAACVGRTRIPVWLLVRIRQLGASDEEILEDYPALSGRDLKRVQDYYALCRAVVDQQIEDNEFS